MPVSIREAQAIDAADCGRTIHAAFAAIAAQQNRTLYSLRDMYATFQIVYGGIDFHLLARQMGTSIAMLEQRKVT